MRLVGEMNDSQLAEKFARFLASRGIEAEIRESDAPNVGIWVLDEDKLSESAEHLSKFRQNPNASIFEAANSLSNENIKKKFHQKSIQKQIARSTFSHQLPLTFGVIVICVVVALFSVSPVFQFLRSYLFFSEELIRQGQVWRLVTPVFLHGGALHLFFNMLWLYQLGGKIEIEEGSFFLGIFIVLIAIVCDVAQYLVSGPSFAGLSGVVYALLGYVWIMSKRSVKTQYEMSDETMIFMLVWLVICLVGIIPNVANTQHVVGLCLGVVWGWLRSRPKKIRNLNG